MLLHDISDIPLAILMICFNLKFWYIVQVCIALTRPTLPVPLCRVTGSLSRVRGVLP